MKLTTKAQKYVLYSLYFETKQTQQGEVVVAKEFPLEELSSAAEAKKKLISRQEGEKLIFADGEVELTVGEASVLKKLFDAKKQWTADEAETVLELQTLFK